jgi:hypothetical protein
MIDELRESIRSKHKPDFDFTRVEDVPFVIRPVKRVALISTAGLYLENQERFGPEDPTFRRIPADADLTRLRIWWDTAATQPASQDLNCAFPLSLLREEKELAPTHYTFSGAIADPRRLIEETAPALAAELEADAALIAPS